MKTLNNETLYKVDCNLYGENRASSYWYYDNAQQPCERTEYAPSVWELAPAWANEMRLNESARNHKGAVCFCYNAGSEMSQRVAWFYDGKQAAGEGLAPSPESLLAHKLIARRSLKVDAQKKSILGSVSKESLLLTMKRNTRAVNRLLEQNMDIESELSARGAAKKAVDELLADYGLGQPAGEAIDVALDNMLTSVEQAIKSLRSIAKENTVGSAPSKKE